MILFEADPAATDAVTGAGGDLTNTVTVMWLSILPYAAGLLALVVAWVMVRRFLAGMASGGR